MTKLMETSAGSTRKRRSVETLFRLDFSLVIYLFLLKEKTTKEFLCRYGVLKGLSTLIYFNCFSSLVQGQALLV